MLEKMEIEIEKIIIEKVVSLNRPDLFRTPIVGFSSADDERYESLKEIVGEWHLKPNELLNDANSVISYFVPFTKDVVSEPKIVADGSKLWGEAYVIINSYFEDINKAIMEYLKSQGHSSTSIRATHTYDPKDMKSVWSHRSAAAIAGLGNFGTNRLLITKRGSGGRFCTVITSAILCSKPEMIEEKCLYKINGSCKLCLKVCPVNALEIDSFNKFACQYVCNKNKEKDIYGADTCGKCISVCPVAYID